MNRAMDLGGRSFLGIVVLALGVLIFCSTTPAFAGFSDQIVTIEVANSQGSASQSWALPSEASEKARLTLANRVDLRGGEGNEVLATIDDLVIELDGDPEVSLDFAVGAGNFATQFTITTAMVSFPPRLNPTAFATAGITLTDRDPLPGDGAALNPVAPNTGLYQAMYNGGTVYADLFAPLNLPGPGTLAASTDTGVQSISGAVSDIQASFSFTLSADDSASGTSRFEIFGPLVPEPSTTALLACGLVGLLALGGRKRRN